MTKRPDIDRLKDKAIEALKQKLIERNEEDDE